MRWRDGQGRLISAFCPAKATRVHLTRVVLAAAHIDNNPSNNQIRNLRALCQRCHMLHDRPHHLRQRRLRHRAQLAVGDLFEGSYSRSDAPGL